MKFLKVLVAVASVFAAVAAGFGVFIVLVTGTQYLLNLFLWSLGALGGWGIYKALDNSERAQEERVAQQRHEAMEQARLAAERVEVEFQRVLAQRDAERLQEQVQRERERDDAQRVEEEAQREQARRDAERLKERAQRDQERRDAERLEDGLRQEIERLREVERQLEAERDPDSATSLERVRSLAATIAGADDSEVARVALSKLRALAGHASTESDIQVQFARSLTDFADSSSFGHTIELAEIRSLVSELREVVVRRPRDSELDHELARGLSRLLQRSWDDVDEEHRVLTELRQLVTDNPAASGIAGQLGKALDGRGGTGSALSDMNTGFVSEGVAAELRELAASHPHNTDIAFSLMRALNPAVNSRGMVWSVERIRGAITDLRVIASQHNENSDIAVQFAIGLGFLAGRPDSALHAQSADLEEQRAFLAEIRELASRFDDAADGNGLAITQQVSSSILSVMANEQVTSPESRLLAREVQELARLFPGDLGLAEDAATARILAAQKPVTAAGASRESNSKGGDTNSERVTIVRGYASIDRAMADQHEFASRSLISELAASRGEQWGLHAATSQSEVAEILQDGAPIDGVARIDYGDNLKHWEAPLLTAFIDGNLNVGQALIEIGADVDAPNAIVFPDGSILNHTALHMLAQRGVNEGAARLIAAGADVNRRTSLGTTPLHFAAGKDNVVLVEMLLKSGADPNVREFDSDRPGGLGDLPVEQAGPRTRLLLA